MARACLWSGRACPHDGGAEPASVRTGLPRRVSHPGRRVAGGGGILDGARGYRPGIQSRDPEVRAAPARCLAGAGVQRVESDRGDEPRCTRPWRRVRDYVAEYATAILCNGLGQYELALDAAQKAAAADEIAISSWALYELVEAASRSGPRDVARAAVDRLSERARASGTDWAKGTDARSRALVENGESAEDLHRQAIDWLGRCGMRAHLARARLTYGEWLRRQNRRIDARGAYDVFTSMGADGLADRARRELLATGETVRKRRQDTRDELTPQEEHIARLAREGRTNQEIGAELYISDRTVEWHLRKVSVKLGIGSRMGLHDALPSRHPEAAHA
jgi:DNA-binding CsgD family transcriptional regulator